MDTDHINIMVTPVEQQLATNDYMYYTLSVEWNENDTEQPLVVLNISTLTKQTTPPCSLQKLYTHKTMNSKFELIKIIY